jgi:ATP-binding cassette, subfamily B, bacterial MsbA
VATSGKVSRRPEPLIPPTDSRVIKDPPTLRRGLSYLRPYRGLFLVSILCMVAFGATDGAVPFLVKEILDQVFQGKNESYLYLFPFILVAISVVRAVADFGQQYLMGKVGHFIVRDLRNDMNDHFLRLGSDYYVENSSASLISRLTSDVLLFRILFTDSLASLIRDSIRIVALITAAITLDPTLAAIAFVAFPLGIYPIQKFGKRMRSLARRGQEAVGEMSSMLQESILGNRIVKVFCAESFEQERFREQNERLTRTFLKSERIRALTGPINEVLASLAAAGVIVYGGHSVMAGSRTQGEFMAFLVALFLLYEPFKKISRVSSAVHQGLAGAQRIFDVLDTSPSIVDPQTPEALPRTSTVELVGVTYRYPSAEREALKQVSLRIEEGKKVALVGLSGAGKSTLVDLVPRFIDPSAGQVLLGGVDIRLLKLEALRSRISLVGQHTLLFNDTVDNNILYGRLSATEDEVREAAQAAFALDFIERLPDRFHTIIGEGGFSLSGGERQRVAIARAILKNAPILILDEATASLDNRSEREVQSAIDKLAENRTSIIIAHRLSTVVGADTIVVMSDGRIVEQGTHAELLERKGEYERLHAYQFRS